MGQRIFASLWLIFSFTMAWMATGFEVQFAYEPVGPKAWPFTLAVMMAAASLYLLVRPGEKTHWPSAAVQLRVLVLGLALLTYTYFFQWLGFPLATALMTIVVGRLFGGSWLSCLVAGVTMGLGLYFFFDRLLDVVLPLGKPLDGIKN